MRTESRLVGGRWLPPVDGRTMPVHDPADTARVVGLVPAMTGVEVAELYDKAVEGARRWRATSAIERAGVLARAADELRSRRETVAADVVAENGKTRAEALVEVDKSADFLDYYAGVARMPTGGWLADARPHTRTSTVTEPVGIVCLITPWNDPLLTPARKISPALAAGNAVILKPAGETPLSGLHLARALHEAGLPAGVLGVAVGRISEIGDALLDDPRLDAVSFTGSTAVGKRLKQRLRDRTVRLQTEMGGKNASAVLADADLPLAVSTVAAAAFGQTGQRCTATSRVVVERAVADAFVAGLVDAARAVRLGPGGDPATTMGPLVSPGQRDDVLARVEKARADGARIVTGGAAPSAPELAGGCFVEPTVVTDVTPEMAIWREEVFGPVVAVRVVDDFDAAVDAVNDSAYGLAAAVFTTDLQRAYEFSDRAEAGQVAVNLPTSGWDVHHPFGGFGDSGSPFKEQGLEGLRFYTRVKTVAVRYAP